MNKKLILIIVAILAIELSGHGIIVSLMRLLNSRSSLESIDIENTPYPKTLSHFLNPV